MPRRPGESETEETEPQARGSKRSPARVVALLVVLAAAITFIVQNGQRVSIRLWFVTVQVHLLWLLLACVVFGVLCEFLIHRTVRSRWRSRRSRS